MICVMVGFDEQARFISERAAMVQMQLRGRGITNADVLDVMGQLPREEFVPFKYIAEAYTDKPLPIGMGQTISQPYIVALMTEKLRLDKGCDVLELGTGCGYQTAILAKLAGRVFTVDRLGQLSESAQTVLGRLGVDNVEFFVGDGSKGWCDDRQFDRIIVTAAMPEVPQPLEDQLKEGGLLIAPVGGEYGQDLMLYEKCGEEFRAKQICGCRFVRLIGKYGFRE
jgi:protein-L-isoaspartate(D-aspartate) O-methyltransferase